MSSGPSFTQLTRRSSVVLSSRGAKRYLSSVRKLIAEFTGTAFITAAVIGSAIMATNLTKDDAVWLLVNI